MVGLEGVSREHATYDREHEFRSIGVGDGGEERRVEVEVPARAFVEHPAGVGEEAALGVGGDEKGRRGRVQRQAILEETRVGAAYGRR